MNSRLPRFALFAFLVLAGGVVSCAVNPVTGKRELSLVSSEQELQIGKEGFGAIVSEYGVYEDVALAAYVDSIGQKLAKTSQLPNLAWKFTVLDDPIVNAFAMPGGFIYITRGILAHLNSEAQLAGVLGHEIGHVTARHTAQRITQQQLAGLGLGLAGMFSTGFRRYSAQAEQALGLLFLKYGRDDENQADALGVQYTAAASWDPREIPGTYATLRRIGERSGQRLPTFLSTHPDPGDREVRTGTLSAQAATGRSNLQVRQRVYFDRIKGILHGSDPRQGYFDAGRFYHPVMNFEMAFPTGWLTQNQRSAVAAMEPQKKGQMQLTLAANRELSPSAYVSSLVEKQAIVNPQGQGESIGGWSAWVGRIGIPQQDGTVVPAVLGLVRQAPDRTLQILGGAAAGADGMEAAVIASIRSLRPIGDPRRRDVTPPRLRVVPSPATGEFQTVVLKLGTPAVPVEDLAILNGMEPDETVRSGQLLKVVEAGRR